jgi:hypothetical protein
MAGAGLPPTFFDWITLSGPQVATADDSDSPASELVLIISRYVHLSAFVQGHALTDGRPRTSSVIRQALQLDAELETWERQQAGKWRFGITCDTDLPPAAAFRGQCHVYSDMWVARVWNHYRWARILVNQLVLDFVQRYPASSLPLVSAAHQARCLEVLSRLAEDVLVSVPTHWRHPSLAPAKREMIERTSGGAGVGAAGIPSLLHQIRVAACSPAVPPECLEWSINVLETIWSELGMLQAKTQAEVIKAHRDKVRVEQPEGILKRGPHYKRGKGKQANSKDG